MLYTAYRQILEHRSKIQEMLVRAEKKEVAPTARKFPLVLFVSWVTIGYVINEMDI